MFRYKVHQISECKSPNRKQAVTYPKLMLSSTNFQPSFPVLQNFCDRPRQSKTRHCNPETRLNLNPALSSRKKMRKFASSSLMVGNDGPGQSSEIMSPGDRVDWKM